MKRAFAVLAFVLSVPFSAHAQSLFSTQGLGVPVAGVDARARALGLNGVGLLGLSTSLLNPAEQGGIFRRGVTAAFQPWGGSVELNGEEGDVSGTRFPVIAAFYPMGRFTFTLGYSGVLDQSWAIVAEGEDIFGADTVGTTDILRSSGGINEAKVGAAFYVNDRLTIGAAVGFQTGNVVRSITRLYEDSVFVPFESTDTWKYSGTTASFGMRWDPLPQLRIGASVAWSGELDAKPDSGTTTSHSYDMPLRFHAGASGQIAPRLMVGISTSFASYGSGSYTAPGASAVTLAQSTSEFGAGLEWSELRAGSRIFPLRVGVRRATLPFHNQGDSEATEFAVSGGVGLRLVEDDFGPLAVADLGFERGTREGWEGTTSVNGLSEKFWRVTVSVSLFGR
jgi:hypothetical protein